jgi:hypothetical protein
VGDTAQSAQPERVETAERLVCLVHCDSGEDILKGTESRTVMDNWFRARRRIHDLADALRKRGMPLPAARSLYRDLDTDSMAAEFTDWYARRHGSEPDPEVAGALAEEWMEGVLPDTWHAVSPHRVEFQLTLINDWISDDPIIVGAKALLPEWVRWHGEQAGLPEHLVTVGSLSLQAASLVSLSISTDTGRTSATRSSISVPINWGAYNPHDGGHRGAALPQCTIS